MVVVQVNRVEIDGLTVATGHDHPQGREGVAGRGVGPVVDDHSLLHASTADTVTAVVSEGDPAAIAPSVAHTVVENTAGKVVDTVTVAVLVIAVSEVVANKSDLVCHII